MKAIIAAAVLALALAGCSSGNSTPLPSGINGQARLVLPGFTVTVSSYWAFLHSDAYDWSVYCASADAPEPLGNHIKSVRASGLAQGVKLDNTSINLAVEKYAPGLLIDSSYTGSTNDAGTAGKLVTDRCAELAQ